LESKFSTRDRQQRNPSSWHAIKLFCLLASLQIAWSQLSVNSTSGFKNCSLSTISMVNQIVRGLLSLTPSFSSAVHIIYFSPPWDIGMVHNVHSQALQNILCFPCPRFVLVITNLLRRSSPLATFTLVVGNLADFVMSAVVSDEGMRMT
jgi:hypothetical protein